MVRSRAARLDRVELMAGWLRLMDRRAHQIVRGDCFQVFSVEDGGSRKFVPPPRSKNRYVQFLMREHWFMLDLPNETLGGSEAQRLLRERSGFFWQSEQPWRTNSPEYIPEFDPLNKAYLYGDERCAAEDVEWIFTELWCLGQGADVRVTSSAFGEVGVSWEKEHPLAGSPVRARRVE